MIWCAHRLTRIFIANKMSYPLSSPAFANDLYPMCVILSPSGESQELYKSLFAGAEQLASEGLRPNHFNWVKSDSLFDRLDHSTQQSLVRSFNPGTAKKKPKKIQLLDAATKTKLQKRAHKAEAFKRVADSICNPMAGYGSLVWILGAAVRLSSHIAMPATLQHTAYFTGGLAIDGGSLVLAAGLLGNGATNLIKLAFDRGARNMVRKDNELRHDARLRLSKMMEPETLRETAKIMRSAPRLG